MPDQELVNPLELAFAERVDASIERYILFLQQLLQIPTPRMREHAAVRFLGAALAGVVALNFLNRPDRSFLWKRSNSATSICCSA